MEKHITNSYHFHVLKTSDLEKTTDRAECFSLIIFLQF